MKKSNTKKKAAEPSAESPFEATTRKPVAINISDCVVNANVNRSGSEVEAILELAKAIKENARAIGVLAEALKLPEHVTGMMIMPGLEQ